MNPPQHRHRRSGQKRPYRPREHPRFFVQSFHHLPMEWLLKEIGDERFITLWPDVRKGFDKDSPSETAVLDAWDTIWGVIASEDSQSILKKFMTLFESQNKLL